MAYVILNSYRMTETDPECNVWGWRCDRCNKSLGVEEPKIWLNDAMLGQDDDYICFCTDSCKETFETE